jgi:hypothetical protein
VNQKITCIIVTEMRLLSGRKTKYYSPRERIKDFHLTRFPIESRKSPQRQQLVGFLKRAWRFGEVGWD